jgi:enolase
MPSSIQSVRAREIFDSRGNPTIEVDVTTELGLFRAAVPSGASTGKHEALELRDGDPSRFLGKGVTKAIANVNGEIAKALKGMDPTEQRAIDERMIALDGTPGGFKRRLGANAILGVSMAVSRAGAAAKQLPLYKHINELAGKPPMLLPVPSFNVINGGEHAGNRLAMQEFMIMPVGAHSFAEAMRMGSEVYQNLKSIIKKHYGIDSTAVGDEGGFAPHIQDAHEAFKLLGQAIEAAGYQQQVRIAMDAAASQFWNEEKQKYDLDFKHPEGASSMLVSKDELVQLYKSFCGTYPLVFVEDPFHEEDFDAYAALTEQIGEKIQVVGDDLLVTNIDRIKIAAEKRACNALLLKVNQIGTVTEAMDANRFCRDLRWGVMVSHRSGETEDSFIADLTVGLGTGQIKSGAPCRSERLAKYNQLLRIEEELGSSAVYVGDKFRTPWER